MSVQPTPTSGTPTTQDSTTSPNQQAWDQTLAQYIAQGAVPIIASLGMSAIQQSTQGAGDN